MAQKLRFWSVFALVTGSQIGTGILILPTTLAPFGILTIFGILFAIFGVLCTALVFANLCSYFPNASGPHAYVEKIFGKKLAFFVGWTYWLVSWISSTTVIIEAVGYLLPLIGHSNQFLCLALELLLLFLVTILNLRGTQAAGRIELALVVMKILPMIIIPLGAAFYFDPNNFVISELAKITPASENIAKVALLVLWGFIGLECATTTANTVENPAKTIPRAVILGTLSVALLYFVNIIGIMGVINGAELMNIRAPYVDVTSRIFGGQWHLLISLISSIVCIGTLNAWTLVAAQIALGLARDGLLPKIFNNKNKNDAPAFSIILSSVVIGLLLIIMVNQQMVQQVTILLNFSTTVFIFVYLICAIALLKFLLCAKSKSKYKILTTILAVFFLSWVVYNTQATTLLIASLFVISGLPLYLIWHVKKK